MSNLTSRIYTRKEIEKNPDRFKWSNKCYALVDGAGDELRFANFEDATHFYENSPVISIDENLAWYHAHAENHYDKPSITVDLIGLRFYKEHLQVMLIKRKSHVEYHKWAFLGGFVDSGESIVHACLRETKEETNVDLKESQLIRMLPVDTPDRDPRMHWLITNPSIVLFTPEDVKTMNARAGDDAGDLCWFNVKLDEDEDLVIDSSAIPLAFDHAKILAKALHHLRNDFNLPGMPLITKLLGDQITTREMLDLYSQLDTKFATYTASNITTLYRKWLVRTDQKAKSKRAGNSGFVYEWKKRDYDY